MPDNTMSVLLVDDDPDACHIFELVMQHHRLPYEIAEDAESALEMLKKHMPDIVVLDLFLPGMDGYQALDRIRRMSSAPECKIVATTAYYTQETQNEVITRGFNGYLPKPFDPSTFVNYLHTVLG